MRNAFVSTLCNLAREDERIWLLCGDLGYSVLEPFIKEFPNRFVNVGVAEQNMIGVAAGLAMSGKTVFVYSIANFPTLRCYEQIRNDVCYHNVNVKIVAVGGGLSYGALGYTHFGVEDLAVMKVLPNMKVLAPGDPIEAGLATEFIAFHDGPSYLRLGKSGEEVIHSSKPKLHLGKALKIADGGDVSIFTTGAVLSVGMQVRDILFKTKKLSAGVISFPFLSPLDTEVILEMGRRTGCVVVIEEHGASGLGSSICEVLVKDKITVKFLHFKFSYSSIKKIRSQNFLRKQSGLDAISISKEIMDLV